jgi:hypothetical protein
MTRSILAGLLGILSIAAVGALPLACQSGGIGDPCTPEDEYNADFPGFKLTEENIESRSFQCSTRICLVNHFQGRVTCPLGQAAPKSCDASVPGVCGKDASGKDISCVEAGVFAPDCVPPVACKTEADCPSNGACVGGFCPEPCPRGLKCDATRKVCGCEDINNTEDYKCVLSDAKDAKSLRVLKSFVCHTPGSCQAEGADLATNKDKACCVPGTDTPATTAVCGQCAGLAGAKSTRGADQAVYCSCRCDIADGAAAEPNFNFCACPTGFSCSQVRPNVGLGDIQVTGKYCVKETTEYTGKTGECGDVHGNWDTTCSGTSK